MFNLFNRTTSQKKLKSDNISFDHNFVFIHIPKNAGTSLGNGLGINTSHHNTVKEYISILGENKYKEMISFAFVRNPFSRFISLYNYARLQESFYHSSINPEKALYGKHMDYETLKNASIEDAAKLLIDGKLIHNPPHVQWNNQCFWLKDQTGKFNVKYLGRFEDINFHLRNITELLSISSIKQLKKINPSSNSNKDYKTLIGHETRTLLEEYYKEDLEKLNYNF